MGKTSREVTFCSVAPAVGAHCLLAEDRTDSHSATRNAFAQERKQRKVASCWDADLVSPPSVPILAHSCFGRAKREDRTGLVDVRLYQCGQREEGGMLCICCRMNRRCVSKLLSAGAKRPNAG